MIQWREIGKFGALLMEMEGPVATPENVEIPGENHELQDEMEDFMGLCVVKRFLGIEDISSIAGDDQMGQG